MLVLLVWYTIKLGINVSFFPKQEQYIETFFNWISNQDELHIEPD